MNSLLPVSEPDPRCAECVTVEEKILRSVSLGPMVILRYRCTNREAHAITTGMSTEFLVAIRTATDADLRRLAP